MSSSEQAMGVILAAGKGSRMYPFSERMPKPILPVLGRPLLAHQVERMAEAGIKKIIIVIGYYGFEIARALGDGSDWGVRIEYVDQERTLGIAHALGCLESKIDRPFLLFLGDIFFAAPGLSGMVDTVLQGKANCVLAARREQDPEAIRRNFAILADDNGRVTRVMEKPRYAAAGLKGCGMYMFDLHVFDAVRRTPRTAARDEYEITDSIQLLIQDGHEVQVMDSVEYDINLTYPEDLLAINQWALAQRGVEQYIGLGYSGPPEFNVKRSVIGDQVSLPPSIEIEDSVIFSDVTVTEKKDLSRVIITPQQILSLDSGARKQ